MPSFGSWVRFLLASGSIVGGGLLVVQMISPSDEDFIKSLSPELRKQYEADIKVRNEFGRIMADKAEKSRDNPAFLNGPREMARFDRQVALEARTAVETSERNEQMDLERQRLRTLAEQEK